ncbi:MAG TPA: hypothetical protein VF501_01110, partial [Thiobacillus sp.]
MAVEMRALLAFVDVVPGQQLRPVAPQELTDGIRHRLFLERTIDEIVHDHRRKLGTFGLLELVDVLLQAGLRRFFQG